ncbi:MAG: hypothetical protein LQ340_002670 [Diploschistes diacapsis]|nr:MAG: hypothetical protein LQ340_002670 [Diploschistes diacapsis]
MTVLKPKDHVQEAFPPSCQRIIDEESQALGSASPSKKRHGWFYIVVATFLVTVFIAVLALLIVHACQATSTKGHLKQAVPSQQGIHNISALNSTVPNIEERLTKDASFSNETITIGDLMKNYHVHTSKPDKYIISVIPNTTVDNDGQYFGHTERGELHEYELNMAVNELLAQYPSLQGRQVTHLPILLSRETNSSDHFPDPSHSIFGQHNTTFDLHSIPAITVWSTDINMTGRGLFFYANRPVITFVKGGSNKNSSASPRKFGRGLLDRTEDNSTTLFPITIIPIKLSPSESANQSDWPGHIYGLSPALPPNNTENRSDWFDYGLGPIYHRTPDLTEQSSVSAETNVSDQERGEIKITYRQHGHFSSPVQQINHTRPRGHFPPPK